MKVFYVNPNEEKDYDELKEMNENGQLFDYAKKSDNVHVYDSVENFATAFNNGYISDEGFIFIGGKEL